MTTRSSQQLRISQRLMILPFAATNRGDELLEILSANRGAVDDVWLFTENDGQDFRYIAMPEVHRRAQIIGGIIEKLKTQGIRASVNILNTVGHSDYAEPFMDPLPFAGIVGPDGQMSVCCACPRQPAFLDYVMAKYTAYAKTKPAAIWIDDDVRVFWHPPKVINGCFCNVCLAEFSKRFGKSWDRETAINAVVRDDYPASNKDRQEWMHFLSDQMVDIHRYIRDVVHAVDPGIQIGAMNTVYSWFTAYYSRFAERWDALRFSPDEVALARPGGGYFSDDRPAEAYHKAWNVAFQNSQYPPNIERHIEVENYPFQLSGKSIASTVLEGSLYLAVGSEGVAFDICGNLGNDPRDQAPYLEAISKRRPYYELIHGSAHGSKPVGLNIALNPEHSGWAPSDGKTIESTDARTFPHACEWGTIGIPLRFASEEKGPSLLVGDLAKGFSPEALEKILRQGAVMDGETLTHLWKVGLGPLLGVSVENSYTTGTFERYVDHPLNSGFEKYVREISQGYSGGTSWTLKSEGALLQPLAKLFNYRNQELGTCAVALETSFESRIVVLGYRPWDYLGLPGKTSQCRNIVDWLHEEKKFSRFDGKGKAVFHAWEKASGQFGGILYNMSGDPLAAPRLVNLPPSQKLQVITPEMSSVSVTTTSSGEVILPDIPAWAECLLSV